MYDKPRKNLGLDTSSGWSDHIKGLGLVRRPKEQLDDDLDSETAELRKYMQEVDARRAERKAQLEKEIEADLDHDDAPGQTALEMGTSTVVRRSRQFHGVQSSLQSRGLTSLTTDDVDVPALRSQSRGPFHGSIRSKYLQEVSDDFPSRTITSAQGVHYNVYDHDGSKYYQEVEEEEPFENSRCYMMYSMQKPEAGQGGALPPSSSSTVRRSVYTTTPKSHIRDIEARLELLTDDYEPPVSQLSTLRSRASNARNMMDREKVLLDRYLPAPTGPIPAVEYEIESMYDELAQRMPSLSRLSGSSGSHDYSSEAVKPYTPYVSTRPRSNSFSGPSRPSARPPISDVRKRCRDVLCKTKGDPTYYR